MIGLGNSSPFDSAWCNPCMLQLVLVREILMTSIRRVGHGGPGNSSQWHILGMNRWACHQEQSPGYFVFESTSSQNVSLHHCTSSSFPSLSFLSCPWQNGFEPLFVFEIDSNTNTIKRRPGTLNQVKSMQCVTVVAVLLFCVPLLPPSCLLVGVLFVNKPFC